MSYLINTQAILKLLIGFNLISTINLAFDDGDFDHADHHEAIAHTGPLPKDKILLKSIESLTFLRNKRTTSRRTHSIPQLSCVGGTAGCKLFTPSVVECKLISHDDKTNKFNWNCNADFKDGRVKFNHLDIICEGYDYPEDDYKLLGSCGLEFTLDYADNHDYHHQSYHEHLDEHEKELFKQKAKKGSVSGLKVNGFYHKIEQLIFNFTDHVFIIFGIFTLLSLLYFIYVYNFSNSVRQSSSNQSNSSLAKKSQRLNSAILISKKTC